MNIRKITNFDYLLFLAVVSLSFIGILFIYSSGINSSGNLVSKEYIKQICFCFLVFMTIGVSKIEHF